MRGETKKKVHDSIYRKCKLIYSERKMNGCLGMQKQGGVGERDYQEIHKKLLGGDKYIHYLDSDDRITGVCMSKFNNLYTLSAVYCISLMSQ